MKKIVLSIFFFASCSFANAQVYQCKVGGNLVFQDKPCTGSKEQQKQIREKQNVYKTAKYEKEKREADWVSRKEPKLGMTTSQAEKSTWGYPDKTNRTTGVYFLSCLHGSELKFIFNFHLLCFLSCLHGSERF